MSEELAIAIVISSLVFLGLTFLIVLAVRSAPNKLLLLGLLMAITAVLLGALVPDTGNLATAMLIPAIALVFVGAICLAIGFVTQLFKAESKDQPKA
jgi:hypothetical protein